jgi:hypothetical protein
LTLLNKYDGVNKIVTFFASLLFPAVKNSVGNGPETVSLPILIFQAVPELNQTGGSYRIVLGTSWKRWPLASWIKLRSFVAARRLVYDMIFRK